MNNNRGFSLVEILLSVALLLAVVGLGIYANNKMLSEVELEAAANMVKQALQSAQISSQSLREDSVWGMEIGQGVDTGKVYVFKGDNFSARDTSKDEIMYFSNLIIPSGDAEVIFNKLSGTASSAKKIILQKGCLYRTIDVSSGGEISVSKTNVASSGSQQDGSATLTSQADWQAGTSTSGIDLTSSPGDVKLSTAETKITDGTWTNGSGNVDYAHDGNTNTSTTLQIGENVTQTNGSTKKYTKVRYQCAPSGIDIDYWNGSAWLDVTSSSCDSYGDHPWHEFTFSVSGTKIRFSNISPLDIMDLFEAEIYADANEGTHTSAPTQIGATGDAGRTVVEYQGFGTTEIEPANTSIDYRFQLVNSSGTSTNGWTAWTTGDVANLTTTYPDQLTITQAKIDVGETYLQVQSKLTSTDGVSTPTFSDYTVNYKTGAVIEIVCN
ncbi:MAG: hypothetical protein CEN89_710 [Candidatus Berkelbacteria bacterium Licking1014_7]|uniref:Prepilin-type N-terminal cleavage/methylation domain-containing protein n=1 Tax=Candidatus Berkelbacteria bacterium Licking1014_7 TaxID=2017147 RepID=A0A554LHU0_9BACT|nr:MAG: hypothetical protein CEN89_710 [Candidatus Berkelbacteria bacterium Licking1014_7]